MALAQVLCPRRLFLGRISQARCENPEMLWLQLELLTQRFLRGHVPARWKNPPALMLLPSVLD